MKYLNDENEYIDQTYLEDIISSGVLYKNKYAQSFNIVLIKNENNDITNNLSIICPNSSYSNYLYNKNRYSIIIYQKDNFFEPLVTVTHNNDGQRIYKKFLIFMMKIHNLIVFYQI